MQSFKKKLLSKLNLRKIHHFGRRNWLIRKTSFLSNILSNDFLVILGSQRSGTTLLQLILSSHSKIKGLDEDDSNYTFPPWIVLFLSKLVGRKTVYKLPTKSFALYQLKRNFSKSKIIWMVRDPLAVVSSMKSLIVEDGQTWLSTYSWDEWEKAARFFKDQSPKLERDVEPAVLGANIWKYKNMMPEIYREKGFLVYTIRYEDLLETPRETLQQLFSFLELDWEESVLNYWRDSERKKLIGNTRADKPIDKSRITPELKLSKEEQEIIKDISKDLARKFSYNY